MVDHLSPLQPVFRPGSHGNFVDGTGVVLSETQPGSIVQVAAWPGQTRTLIAAIRQATGLALPDGAGGGVALSEKAAFGIAPGKFLVVDQAEGLAKELATVVTSARDVAPALLPSSLSAVSTRPKR